VGNRREQGNRWDIPACLNTVGEKALLEFKVKNTPSNTWTGEQIRTNGKKKRAQITEQVRTEACRPLSIACERLPFSSFSTL